MGGHFMLAATAGYPGSVEKIVPPALVSDRGYRPLQQQDGIRVVRIEPVSEAQQRMILAVEPKYIAVHDKKCVFEQRQGLLDATARIEELRLLRDLDVRRVAAVELGGDHLGLVVNIDDDTLDADERQPVDR